MEAPESAQKKPSFLQTIRGMPANFWYANLMEILERLAFFGARAIVALYLIKGPEENGLQLSYPQKHLILGIWAILQCIIPMVSGGYTDRYGYRKSLAVAFILNIIGYLLMAQSRPLADALGGTPAAGFWVFLLAACFVAVGTAIFKPPCHGTIAKATTEETASMGWGIFYFMVNIGGAAAPMLAASLRGEIDWSHVFYACAVVTSLNFLPAFLLYKEPEKVPAKEGEQEKGPVGVFISSIATIFTDLRLVVFLLIFSCFWLMFMQLWDLLPNFIDEWVDTSDVAPAFAWLSGGLSWLFGAGWVLDTGQVKPEMIININPMSVILLVLIVSWIIRKLNKVAAMVIGMVISMVGFVAAGSTALGWFCCLMILVFSIGEMTCSPTFSAYVGLIAPKDKKALYMGYSNIPFAIGWGVGNFVAGFLYEHVSSKFRFAREYLVDRLGMDPEFVSNTKMLPNTRTMEVLAYAGQGGDVDAVGPQVKALWGEVDWQALPGDQVADKVAEIYTQAIGQIDFAAVQQATGVLWDLHHPYLVWYYLGIFGIVGTLGMIIFYFATRKSALESKASQEAA